MSNTLSQKLISLPSYRNTNAQVKFGNDSLKDVLDDFAPLTTKQIQRRKILPWYSPEIKDAKKIVPQVGKTLEKIKIDCS